MVQSGLEPSSIFSCGPPPAPTPAPARHRLPRRVSRLKTVLPSAAAKKLNCAVSRSATSWRWLLGMLATPSAPRAHCLPSAQQSS